MSELNDDLAALRIEREPDRPGMGRAVRWAIVLVVLAAGSFAAWKWYSQERPLEVEVGTVTERAVGTQAAVLNAAGYVTARRRATVSSKITGKVVEVNVEEGMAVKEGQVLARLDDQTAKASLALAEAQVNASRRTLDENEVRLSEARVTLKRMQDLFKGGIIGQADVDAAQAQVDSIAARIHALNEQTRVSERQADFARTSLDDTIIRAPFSGIAISKDAQPGEMVSPVSAGGGFTRTGICTIVDMHSLEIEVDVNESYINRVRPKQEVSAILDAYPDFQIPAAVITMVPTADRQKATVLVRIGFKALDPRILPDMGVKVTFLREDSSRGTGARAGAAADAPPPKPVALVAKTAVKDDKGQTIVFVVSGDVVERRAVKTGGTDGDKLEIVAGLQGGEKVVLAPPATLAGGMKIKVK